MENLKAKKSLGQHFLNSASALAKIISAAKIKDGDLVLEIGPGTGILTRALLEVKAKVIAVEKDSRACELLRGKFKKEIADGSLVLHESDILTDFNGFSLQSPYKIVANIPYYITGAILRKFLEEGPRPESMVLLVQKEVAERIIAKDGAESVLSMSVKAFGEPKIAGIVPRGAFTPAPKVDSAILTINNVSDKRFTAKNLEIKGFFEVLRAGFAHKRKYLISNLKGISDEKTLESVWRSVDLDEKIRAEDLPLEKWFEITAAVHRK